MTADGRRTVATIPIANPKAAYLMGRRAIEESIVRVLESGWYILGKEVSDFERKFAGWCGCSRAVGVANGTDAVELAIRSVGVREGDCVVTVSNTANATVSAIERIGAVPAFADPLDHLLHPRGEIHLLQHDAPAPQLPRGL